MNLFQGDCLEKLKLIESNSVDSLVTDPPAGISFMGKEWDGDKGGRFEWVRWMTEVMIECKRTLKPGAYGLVWALPRTSHWTATACEDAGFEVRDIITHLFGTGFPKSHNLKDDWKGWGTALKPANEHWILIRKPLSEKTVAKNVEKWGCGAINVDGCRIGTEVMVNPPTKTLGANSGRERGEDGRDVENWKRYQTESKKREPTQSIGRWPSNLVLSCDCESETHAMDCAVAMLDEQSGGASRFFYCAKVSSSERNAGMESSKEQKSMSTARVNSPDLTGKFPDHDGRIKTGNFHPTVKSQKLMGYLIRLITPPNGLVLDPFMGSGSTGLAAKSEGFRFIGIEKESEYFEISQKRINSI